MDIFSHALLCFIFGQALQLDTNAQIVLIVSSLILDIDAISIPSRGTWFQFHRGSLHSIPAAILVSILISMGYTILLRLPATVFPAIVLICAGGLFSHILLDLLTSGSIAALWPFSTKRFTLALTHSVDPIFLGVLLLTSVLIVGVSKDVDLTRIAVIGAMVVLFAHFGIRRYERDAAIRTVRALNPGADSKVTSLPTMRPDRWRIAMKTQSENGCRCKIYSVDSIRKKILNS